MKEYSAKEIKELKSNPYTLNVTKYKLSHTVKFKEDFWIKYQVGIAPRKILEELGYNPEMFGQKRIDSLVQRIKGQALSGDGFTEGSNRTKRMKIESLNTTNVSAKSIDYMQHELQYLRQEVEFLKKIIKADNSKRKD
ncbi:MAG: hypothetical protein Q8900_09710 [Bacillota bacterium]|nr:hypothetical protein [Bacillota bacterium]